MPSMATQIIAKFPAVVLEQALRQLEAADLLVAKQRLAFPVEPDMLRGVALAGQGAVDEAIARIREGVTRWTGLGRSIYLTPAMDKG
jgi:hypothetical protein